MRNDQEFNIKFVSIIEEYPCLYDNTREEYHLSHVQERTWAKIAKDIGEGATPADCKRRWKNLRGSYTKHIKTYVPSGSGASSKRPYYLSEYISFILPYTKSRQCKGNVKASNKIEMFEFEQLGSLDEERNYDSGDQQSVTEEVNQDSSNIIFSEKNILQENDSFNYNKGKQKKNHLNLSVLSENTCKPKRNRNNENQITLEDVNKSAFEYFQKKKQLSYRSPAFTDDADMQFLLSLLPDLKKMTDRQKRKYKVGILNLAGEILEEPRTSASLLSTSSLGEHNMPSSRSSPASSSFEIVDLQPSY